MRAPLRLARLAPLEPGAAHWQDPSPTRWKRHGLFSSSSTDHWQAGRAAVTVTSESLA